MTFSERAVHYYLQEDMGCAAGLVLAANEVYSLGLSREACQLFEGFRGGMGCGGTCGCLAAAVGILSRMYGGKPELKDICGNFVKTFETAMGSGTTDCSGIGPGFKTPERRCAAAVELASRTLEDYIARLEGKKD